MAKVVPAEFLESISGRLTKTNNSRGNVYRNTKFGNLLVRSNFKTSGFSSSQLAAQSTFTQAAATKATLMANTTQMATYKAQFAAQSKYKTLNGYMMAVCIEQINDANND